MSESIEEKLDIISKKLDEAIKLLKNTGRNRLTLESAKQPMTITERQKNYIIVLCKEKRVMIPDDLNYLSKEEASKYIDKLERM